jgi:hypothetical protein
VRQRQGGHVHSRGQWLLVVRYARRLHRGPPELHRGPWRGWLRVQHRSNLLERGRSVRERQYADDMRAGRARLLLRLGKLAVCSAPELLRSGRYGCVFLQGGPGLHLDQ